MRARGGEESLDVPQTFLWDISSGDEGLRFLCSSVLIQVPHKNLLCTNFLMTFRRNRPGEGAHGLETIYLASRGVLPDATIRLALEVDVAQWLWCDVLDLSHWDFLCIFLQSPVTWVFSLTESAVNAAKAGFNSAELKVIEGSLDHSPLILTCTLPIRRVCCLVRPGHALSVQGGSRQ